ncbi:helix-turn-helix transcriptional regulator [Amycolatopsis sp. NPDC051903]|uniref:helix-turn-helix transcriptional regulator n=1 Tax=Amycolatopsis sp. NPDC051903 TaxID=3363936 RepID=UPI00379B30FC
MQFESTDLESDELFRVRVVAAKLDCSLATIYRAVESGALRAIRLGTGKGAVRIPGQAVQEYVAACQLAAATRTKQAHTNTPQDSVSAGGAA